MSAEIAALKQELKRIRKKARILQECATHKCCVFDPSPLTDVSQPKGFKLALVFRPVGEPYFVFVFGDTKESILHVANFFANEKYPAVKPEYLINDSFWVDVSLIGANVSIKKVPYTVTKIDPYCTSEAITGKPYYEGCFTEKVQCPASIDGVYTPWVECENQQRRTVQYQGDLVRHGITK